MANLEAKNISPNVAANKANVVPINPNMENPLSNKKTSAVVSGGR